MTEYLVQDTSLIEIADAIREKTKGTAEMTLAEMVTAISGLSMKKIAIGQFSVTTGVGSTTSVYTKTITHGFGETPNFATVFTPNYSKSTNTAIISWQDNTGTTTNMHKYYYYSGEYVADCSDTATVTMNTTNVVFDPGGKFYGSYYYVIGVI